MPGDCERCYPVPLPENPNWARCGRCKTVVCWPTHVAYDQEWSPQPRWPDSMPLTPSTP
jgi:hypothetical protein